ncbi:helix-turn-helix domain-containing protein [Streptomyces alkaliterrae]|uniref:Helix-turn-helix transcriptional regulator n=1 Tax=Streptomyces alkaliterrae TaxID=2213162 RepID=A0A7W3ZV26_9ACTN|nr:helix-turn-helix transcriptional regulator [Streptomyces alkaliterrae]MBB1261566.1 helix-turn-helix transcriptional regulator [Streptomyces alkaliterrae]
MDQWSDLSTGERIKALRGRELTQQALAERTGLSLHTVQSAEQNRRLTLPTLMRLADALCVDTAVVLGQQPPRGSARRSDLATVRALSLAVHDTSAGLVPEADEAPTPAEVGATCRRAWDLYWQGRYTEAGGLTAPLLGDAAVCLHAQPDGQRAEAWGHLSDAYRVAAYSANLMGVRDLAYAAIGHAAFAASQAADDLRRALVESGRAWVYLRDARLPEALALAEKSALTIEPRFSRATVGELTAYGSHINFAAVVASRMGDADRAGDYLSQSHATGARMGREERAHGTLFGPTTAATQAVGIHVALGQTGKALGLIDTIGPTSALSNASQRRYELDKAMALADARLWDRSLETLEAALTASPVWARYQQLPRVILEKVGKGSTARLRRVAKLVGRPAWGADYPTATRQASL